MARKKILLQTNAPWLKTGLAENGRELMKYFHNSDKYELVYCCTQTPQMDPVLGVMPVKSYGVIPTHDQNLVNQLNQNPMMARDCSYGNLAIEDIVKKEKPDIHLMSDDIWGFNGSRDRSYAKKINSIYHITIDSKPILGEAFEQAKSTPHYYTWAKFAADEMKRVGKEYGHVKNIYGAADISKFSPISQKEKNDLRKQFGIRPETTIIGFLFRNQLRKEAGSLLVGFKQFKLENPQADVKIHLHTSYSERQNGWYFEQLIGYYQIDPNDILCTYVCKNCGKWEVRPYKGEDQDCRFCGSKKSQITPNIVHGVPSEELKYIYGLWDAGINVHTSGGQEYNCCNTLLCGLPLGCTNYSSGEDFCAQPFVYNIGFHVRLEAGTNFIKSANDIKSIKSYIQRVYRMPEKEKAILSERGREWALNTFSTNCIGNQWESLFDSFPAVDWSTIQVISKSNKNPDYPFPDVKDPNEFLDILYKQVLNCVGGGDKDGLGNWLRQLENGTSRMDVYKFFVQIAINDNNKNKPFDLWEQIDKTTGRKRGIICIKQSIGDCLMVSSLFKSFHEQYKDHDLYVMTLPQYFEIFEGNPYVFKILPHTDAAEIELVAMGAGKPEGYFNVVLYPAILSQVRLGYLSQSNALQYE